MNNTEPVIESAKLLLETAKSLNTLAENIRAYCGLVIGSPSEVTEAPKPVEAKKPITLEEVRGVLADKSRTGHTAEVRSIIMKYGAEKLSMIAPENYEAVIRDAEAL